MDQLEGELRLEFGFIEAREGAPGVGRLELRRGVALFTAERAIKPPERVADAALPGDLEEAAYVDGATPLQVFYKVLLPLIAPGLVTTGLLAFIAAWNEYLYALSFIQSPNHYTVPLAITSFVSPTGSAFAVPWGQIMAATVVVTLPLITATLVLQRRILAGLTAGAVKG